MIKKNYIGITGFTKEKEIKDTLDYIKNISSKHTYMFGFLLSQKTIDLKPIKNKRYLNFKNIEELKKVMSYSANKENIVNMIHFNTNKENFSEVLNPVLKDLDGVVEAVQFNLTKVNIKEYLKIKKEFPQIKLLFQINNNILNEYSLTEIKEIIKEVGFSYCLIDLSGGTGKNINLKATIEMFNELSKTNINIGFAGGLGPDNVKNFLIESDSFFKEYFIDAESKLRDKLSDSYGDDIWNQEKVNEYILNSLEKSY